MTRFLVVTNLENVPIIFLLHLWQLRAVFKGTVHKQLNVLASTKHLSCIVPAVYQNYSLNSGPE